MEPATDKQKAFMKSLGVSFVPDCTKDEAKAMIERKLVKTTEEVVTQKIPEKPTYQANQSYYVAYAKDLIVSGMTVEDAIAAIIKLRAEL